MFGKILGFMPSTLEAFCIAGIGKSAPTQGSISWLSSKCTSLLSPAPQDITFTTHWHACHVQPGLMVQVAGSGPIALPVSLEHTQTQQVTPLFVSRGSCSGMKIILITETRVWRAAERKQCIRLQYSELSYSLAVSDQSHHWTRIDYLIKEYNRPMGLRDPFILLGPFFISISYQAKYQ